MVVLVADTDNGHDTVVWANWYYGYGTAAVWEDAVAAVAAVVDSAHSAAVVLVVDSVRSAVAVGAADSVRAVLVVLD